ncbi:MAG: sugar phosphate isomerase/epimerase [Clostridia bacterium]|nr:sugar phosphate isomerase/epimerase [Clostridia bacterium]
MKIGASTSNFYPLPLEEALDTVLGLGIRHTELFFNAACELEAPFVDEMRRRLDAHGATAHAIHPHTSFMEPHFLFSIYERRADEMLDNYKRNFEAAVRLGARYVVLHGDRAESQLTVEQSLERYERLYDLGATFGVRVAQENVVRFRAQSLEYIRALRENLGEKAAFVLDVKQTVRCSYTVEQVAEAMGDAIVHVHVSDHTAEQDCLLPGAGTFDFGRLRDVLKARNYHGAVLMELYRHSFPDAAALQTAAAYLEDRMK